MNKSEKSSKFDNQLILTRKKIRMDIILLEQAEIKLIKGNHGVFKSFEINQSESSITYEQMFIFFDINESESSF